MRLYSKDTVVRTMEAMRRTGRFAHTYILTGDKGFGKKTAALYIAMTLLCDNNSACGTCRQCRRILSGQHPDVIIPEKDKDKKPRIYTVDIIREKVAADAFTAPNDCDRKVYILPDCEGWKNASQDALLKITEEPPESAYFIFTAQNRSSFLSTLVSRSMCIEIPEADSDSCRECLADMGKYRDEDINRAVSLFGGNIGRCADFLEGNSELTDMAAAASEAAAAMADRNEYTLLRLFTEYSADREKLRQLLEMTAKIVRDGCVMQLEGASHSCLGCSEKSAAMLAQKVYPQRLTAMYDDLCSVSEMCMQAVNASAAAAMLAGRLVR